MRVVPRATLHTGAGQGRAVQGAGVRRKTGRVPCCPPSMRMEEGYTTGVSGSAIIRSLQAHSPTLLPRIVQGSMGASTVRSGPLDRPEARRTAAVTTTARGGCPVIL